MQAKYWDVPLLENSLGHRFLAGWKRFFQKVEDLLDKWCKTTRRYDLYLRMRDEDILKRLPLE